MNVNTMAMLSILAAGLAACADDRLTAINDAEFSSTKTESGGVDARVQYEVRTITIRYSERFGALVDSNRIRFSEYDDGFAWATISDHEPIFEAGTTIDGATIESGGPIRTGGWSTNPQASYLPRVADRTANTDREALRAAIQALPRNREIPERPYRPHQPPQSRPNAIQWRSPVTSNPADSELRVQGLRTRASEESRIAETKLRFRIGDTVAGSFVDVTFDENLGEVIEQIAYHSGRARSTLTRDYVAHADAFRIANEVLESFGDDGRTTLHVERHYSYSDLSN